MIRIASCSVMETARPDEERAFGSDGFPGLRSRRRAFKATLELVMDEEGRERLAAILAQEFGTTAPEPTRPAEERPLLGKGGRR